jgi:hypothetical protein
MEVHHPHHAPHRKKWMEYLFEFFMLFLAVTLGFFVENQREHYIEHRREEKFIRSLVRDLEMDTASLQASILFTGKVAGYFDSLVYLMEKGNARETNELYFYARHLNRTSHFAYHDGTIMQLKNAGNLRLIRNENVKDSILVYDINIIKPLMHQQETEEYSGRTVLHGWAGKIFNGFVWNTLTDPLGSIKRPTDNPPLLSRDTALVNDFILHLVALKTSHRLGNNSRKKAMEYAGRLISLLKQAYELE